MKIKVTKPGIYGANGEIAVGETITVKEEPKAWKGRYEVIDAGDQELVVNPAALDPQLRRNMMAEAAEMLEDGDFTNDGKPEVSAVNAMLEDGVARFTAEERDAIWAEIGEAVMKARAE